MSGEPPKSRVRVGLAAIALASCLAIVLTLTMWPVPVDQGYGGAIAKMLAVLHRNGVPEWFGYNKLEFSANVVMFVPIGFLVALILPMRAWWLALIVCPLFSVAIELTQGAFLSARFATVSDVVSNSIGAVVGVLIAVTLRALVYTRDQKVVARVLWEREVSGAHSASRAGSLH
ncbi:VanZ family protein [Lacisediminihabitans sp.]|uniref:VanZ family protein n=1 Tax=Lacisediminihabitans sp. TaxID=2787631 RepID=UPI00374DBA9E